MGKSRRAARPMDLHTIYDETKEMLEQDNNSANVHDLNIQLKDRAAV